MRLVPLLMLALIALPRLSAAQQEIDQSKIVECIRVAEKRADPEAAARSCAYKQADLCQMKIMTDATSPVGRPGARAICAGAELAVWQTLMTAAYQVASGVQGDPVRPAFIKAHEAWQAFVDAECDYERVLTGQGTDAASASAWCAIGHVASRYFLYRQLAR